LKSSTSLIKKARPQGVRVAEWNPREFQPGTVEEADELHMLAEGVTHRQEWIGQEEHTEGGSGVSFYHAVRAGAVVDEATALRDVVEALIRKKSNKAKRGEDITSVVFKSGEIAAVPFEWQDIEVLGKEEDKKEEEQHPHPDDELVFEPQAEVDFAALEEQKQHILAEAERQAQESAQQIITQAKFEAENVLQQARVLAEETVLSAKANEATITQEAFQRGMAAAQDQAIVLLEGARAIVSGMQTWQEQMLANSETEVIGLVKTIAQNLFASGFVLDAETLRQAFAQAVKEAKPLGDMRIRANPLDVEALGTLWAEQQAALTGVRVEMVPSEAVLRGGCIVEGEFGSLDGRVEEKLKRVLERVDEAQSIREEGEEAGEGELIRQAASAAAEIAEMEDMSAQENVAEMYDEAPALDIGIPEPAAAEDEVIDLSADFELGGGT